MFIHTSVTICALITLTAAVFFGNVCRGVYTHRVCVVYYAKSWEINLFNCSFFMFCHVSVYEQMRVK